MNLTQFNRILRQAFLLPVIALLLTAFALYWQIRNANETVQVIQQADARIAQASMVANLIVDQESGLRGYETTGDERFLIAFPRMLKTGSPPSSTSWPRLPQLDAVQRRNIEDLRNDYPELARCLRAAHHRHRYVPEDRPTMST